MKKYIYPLLVLLLGACDSLRQEVDPSYLTKEPEKLVVMSFISPQDTMLRAVVSLSRPVLGEESNGFRFVANATLTISDGSREATFQQNSSQNAAQLFYFVRTKDFPIQAGRTYTLTVRAPDGRQVTARTTVPAPVTPQDLLLDSTQTFRDGRRSKEYFVRLRWNDPTGSANYYRVAGLFRYRPASPAQAARAENLINFSRNEETRDLVDDRQNDGQLLISSRGFFLMGTTGTSTTFRQILDTFREASFSVDLLHTDENYYRYHEAVTRQNQTGGNPFAEPVLIPSSINGGLGCFGSYNRTNLPLRLK
ncbi:DUF4249 domain-containing protein [Tellurirhabdus rosea]|uniref:DUF4249 domain-containing protein n=1 Tax=Tellurirhabdus rosea TaxID=2674997 RepID=UPI0022587019|nr:DUF4249 domain-containing protein [Tellurirhabdus rosea]